MFRLGFITGASSGIGLALARLLAEQGINLFLTGRNSEKLYALADELRSKVNVVVHVADLEKQEDVDKLVEKLHELKPDLLVNNAGFGAYGEAIQIPTDVQLGMVQVNSKTVLQLTLEGARAMREAKISGVVMNISSAAAFLPIPHFAVYCASKSFVNTLSEAMDQELKKYGIRVLASCPGRIETSFQLRASAKNRKSPPGDKMTVDFAVREIWWQIQAKRALHIFDWRYRLLIFLSRYLVPKPLLYRYLKYTMKDERTHLPEN